jgi:SAM-dependent methyltransferase
MKSLKNFLNRIIAWQLTHNFVLNNFIIWLGLEHFVNTKVNPYRSFKIDKNKNTQENSGYSDRAEINEVIEKSKRDLVAAANEFSQGEKILDIGCGPGMYLKLFDKRFKLSGTDINEDMLKEAKINNPEAKFYHGPFLDININEKFDFIYCIGVIIYVPRSEIKDFLNKAADLLDKGGILYLNYPHAISLLDVLFSDLSYMQYSPRLIEKLLNDKFEIIRHEQAFDGRKVGLFDKTPYKSLNPKAKRTYKNSYLLIARKK